jgi:hypothetical protein
MLVVLSMGVQRWKLAILMYLLIVVVLLIFKPSMFFGDHMKIKEWHVQTTSNSSIFSAKFVLPLLGVVSYYIVVVLLLLLQVA